MSSGSAEENEAKHPVRLSDRGSRRVDRGAPPGIRSRQELASTRQYLESVIEQAAATNEELRAANEEIVSSKEELRSTNEELQAAKEELQATNEELRTINDEMTERNEEAKRLNDDLTNVLSSVEIPILIVGRDSRLRRFTPAAAKLFGLIATDVGRPVGEIRGVNDAAPTVTRLMSDVLERLGPRECSMQQADRWHQLSVRPYVTLDGRIDGTVVTAHDVDAEIRDAERSSRRRADLEFRDVLNSATEGILMVGPDGRIQFANPSVTRLFGYEVRELMGQSANCLVPDGHREEFATWLADLLAERTAPALEPGDLVGLRKDGTEFALELSASVTQLASGPMAVAFISDVTQNRTAALEIRAYQERLQRMAFDATLTEEQERRRIAVQLHDSVGQELALARIKLAPLQAELEGAQRTAAGLVMGALKRAIDSSSALAFELSPPILYDLGLGKALEWLADAMETLHAFKLEVIDDGATDSLDDATKAIVFRSVRELVMNVLKHANIGTARVSLRQTDEECEIDVADSGIGFDPDRETTSRSHGGGFGLLSVREQITRLGGTLSIESAPQRGTGIRIRVPCVQERRRRHEGHRRGRPQDDAGGASRLAREGRGGGGWRSVQRSPGGRGDEAPAAGRRSHGRRDARAERHRRHAPA